MAVPQPPRLGLRELACRRGFAISRAAWRAIPAARWASRNPAAPAAADRGQCLDAAQDAIGLFLAERCTAHPAATTTAGDLWKAWRAFAEEIGEPAGSQRLFAEALTARGIRRDRSETARFYRGIGLTPDTS